MLDANFGDKFVASIIGTILFRKYQFKTVINAFKTSLKKKTFAETCLKHKKTVFFFFIIKNIDLDNPDPGVVSVRSISGPRRNPLPRGRVPLRGVRHVYRRAPRVLFSSVVRS